MQRVSDCTSVPLSPPLFKWIRFAGVWPRALDCLSIACKLQAEKVDKWWSSSAWTIWGSLWSGLCRAISSNENARTGLIGQASWHLFQWERAHMSHWSGLLASRPMRTRAHVSLVRPLGISSNKIIDLYKFSLVRSRAPRKSSNETRGLIYLQVSLASSGAKSSNETRGLTSLQVSLVGPGRKSSNEILRIDETTCWCRREKPDL